jgi:hypothetical protein
VSLTEGILAADRNEQWDVCGGRFHNLQGLRIAGCPLVFGSIVSALSMLWELLLRVKPGRK